jgi:hypothetical protein
MACSVLAACNVMILAANKTRGIFIELTIVHVASPVATLSSTFLFHRSTIVGSKNFFLFYHSIAFSNNHYLQNEN